MPEQPKLEDLLSREYIKGRLGAIITNTEVYNTCVPAMINFQLFADGYANGYTAQQHNKAEIRGLRMPTPEFTEMVMKGIGDMYSIGYQLGQVMSQRESKLPREATKAATYVHRVLGNIGYFLTKTEEGKRQYQQIFEDNIRGRPGLFISGNEG